MKKLIKTLMMALSAISLLVLASCNNDSSDNNAALLLLSTSNSQNALTEEDKDPNFTSGWYISVCRPTNSGSVSTIVFCFDKNKNLIDVFNTSVSEAENLEFMSLLNDKNNNSYGNAYDCLSYGYSNQKDVKFYRIDGLVTSDSKYKAIIAAGFEIMSSSYDSPANWTESNSTEWKASSLSQTVAIGHANEVIIPVHLFGPYETLMTTLLYNMPKIENDESICSVRFSLSGVLPNKDSLKSSLIDSNASVYACLPLEITGVSAGQTTVKLSYPGLEDIVINVNVTAAE